MAKSEIPVSRFECVTLVQVMSSNDDMLGRASLAEAYRGSYVPGSPLGSFGWGALLASLAVVCLFVCFRVCFLVFPPFRGFGVESGMIKVKVQGCLLSSPGSPNIGSSRYAFTLVCHKRSCT